MSKKMYSLRCQDLHDAVYTNVDSTSGVLTDYKSARVIGMAGQVISTLHGVDVVDYQRFEPIAAHQYGIDSAWLERVFDTLQECDLVNVIGKKNNPEKVYIKSKYLKSNYDILSEYFVEEMNPKEVEISTVDILQNLSISPTTTDDIKKEYNLSNDEMEKLKLFGTESQLFQLTEVDKGIHLVSSPMYWDENAEEAHKIIQEHSPELFQSSMQKIKRYQGLPIELDSSPIMAALVTKGILPTPTIRMDGSNHQFLFTPYNTKPEERIIVEKARDILSCVRCGQHFAKYPITNPYYILNALQDSSKGYRLRATTVAKEQYFLLASKGIGRLNPTGNGWYSFELIDTPDNLKAVRLAIELLTYGEKVEGGSFKDEEIKQFLGTRGTSISMYKSIKEANKKKDVSPHLAKELLNCIHGAYTYKGGRSFGEK